MLEAGQAAPDFTLPDQDGTELTLSALNGETVVLYFYPRADTPINSVEGPRGQGPEAGLFLH
jgi:peroxiredoxin